MSLPTEDLAPETPAGELVRWMAPGETRFGPAGVAAAFAAGVLVGLGALAASRWLKPLAAKARSPRL